MSDAVFGEEYYRDVYRHYVRQNPPRKHAYYHSLIDLDGPGRILDVGCAFGHFLASVPETWERWGTDPSAYAISRAVDPALRLAVASAHELPSDSFDVITAFDVLEHLTDLDRARQAIHDGLRPGGRFVFVVPVYDGLSAPIIRLLDRDPTHVQKHGRAWWLEWASARFNVQRWEGLTRWLFPWGSYLHCPTIRWRTHTPAIAVVCQR
jgi:SAM-dependent methyltransferase